MTVNIAELEKEEFNRCQSFLNEFPQMRCPPRLGLDQFVKRSLMLHRGLIERWGGPDCITKPTSSPDLNAATQAAGEEYQRLQSDISRLVQPNIGPAFGRTEGKGERPQNFNVDVCLYDPDYGVLQGGAKLGYQCSASRTILDAYPNWKVNFQGYKAQSDKRLRLYLGKYYRYTKTGNWKEYRLEAECRVEERFAAVVMRALKEHHIDRDYPRMLKCFEMWLQRLGESAWAPQSYYTGTIVTVRPSRFLQLGNYGERSCFQNGGERDANKLFFSCDVPDSFVLVGWRNAKPEPVIERMENALKQNRISPNYRAWGIGVPERGAFVSNFYLLDFLTVAEAVKAALSEALAIKGLELVKNPGMALRPFSETAKIYFNPDGRYLCGGTAFQEKYFMHYLQKMSQYSAAFGTYTRLGSGPEFALDPVTGLRGLPKHPAKPRSWPYPEADLREMHVGGVSI